MIGAALVLVQGAFVVLWFIAASLVGRLADRRGYQAWPWVLVAVFATPFVAWFVLMLITPRDGPRSRLF